MNKTPIFQLNDGNRIPALGFGVFQIPTEGATYDAVLKAIDLGYRHIDTAVAYFNEEEVGRAVNDSGVAREEIWITSKMWLQDYAYEDAKQAIETSLSKLGVDYLDLYLLHQPYGKLSEAWKAMVEAKVAGKIRSIGVSNMTSTLWTKWQQQGLFDEMRPSVNQVEFNPYSQQKELRKLMAENQVTLEAWGPLGQGNAELFNESALQRIANKYNKNVGQVILRFEHQEGIIVFPKSVHKERMQSNQDIFDFELN